MHFPKNLKFRWLFCLNGCFLCFGVKGILKLIIMTILELFFRIAINWPAFTNPVLTLL